MFGLIGDDVGETEEEVGVIVSGQLIDLGFGLGSDFIVISGAEGRLNDVFDLVHLLFEALSL